MGNKFNSINKKKLDTPKRREVLPPNEVLMTAGLTKGSVLADVGCGIGYFTFPAAEIVGRLGKVFAIDIEDTMIEEIEKRIETCGYENVRPIISTEYDFKLPDEACNFVFMSTVLHEVDDKEKLIYEAKRILEDGGKLIVLDWQKIDSDWGPPVDHRIAFEVAMEVMGECGLRNIESIEINRDFYCISGIK